MKKALLTSIIVLAAFEAGILAYFYLLRSSDQVLAVKNQTSLLTQAAKNNVKLILDGKIIILKNTEISKWLESYIRAYTGQKDLRLSDDLTKYVSALADNYFVPVVDAKLQFENDKVTVFSSSKEGQKIDVELAVQAIKHALISNQTTIELPTEVIRPKISLESINELGINYLLATGESDFSGSSPARIQNIHVAADKFNGLVLKPGEEFSFNAHLGPVEGPPWAPEKVIKNHKLIYEFGGGICQVSTTLFRAAILSGLPILERKPHAFPVKYYNPQGMDATVYPGVQDFKFKNETAGHILLQAKIEGLKLKFEIYGTKDDVKITIAGPYEYDKNPDGSMKAYFIRTIESVGGIKKEEKFNSTYRSPALYPLETPNPLE